MISRFRRKRAQLGFRPNTLPIDTYGRNLCRCRVCTPVYLLCGKMQSPFRIDWPSHPLSKKTLDAPRLPNSHRRHTAVTCLVINFQTSRVPLGTRIPATYCCCIIYKENPTLSARKLWHAILSCLFQWYKNHVRAHASHSSSRCHQEYVLFLYPKTTAG